MQKKKVKVERLNDVEKESQSRKDEQCRSQEAKMMWKPRGSTMRKLKDNVKRPNDLKTKGINHNNN